MRPTRQAAVHSISIGIVGDDEDAPFGVGGITTAISLTPAAWAGQTVISSVDG